MAVRSKGPGPRRMPELGGVALSAVIIDSQRGTRRLDNTRSFPTSLRSVESSRTVLDWVLHALSSWSIEDITYIGGYHIQKVIERYPDMRYRFHAGWRGEGELVALRLARPTLTSGCVIMRSSTICVPEALRQLLIEGEGLPAAYYFDGSWERFAGLIALPASYVSRAFSIAESMTQQDVAADLEQWLSTMTAEGLPVRRLNLDGLVAPAHDPVAVARTVFGGKGRTLEQVAPLIKSAVVLDQVRFRASDWLDDPDSIIGRVQEAFSDNNVVVRSCAYSEDGLEESAAGRFESVLDVPVDQADRLREAVDKVVKSYQSSGRILHRKDEVLVQPQLRDLAVAGVLLTRDIETGAPYYVLNIDRSSGRSDLITSGKACNAETFYIPRHDDCARLDADVQASTKLGRELEELTHLDDLDIEFGIDRAGTTYLFQVRPISKRARKFELADDDLFEELLHISEFLRAHLRPHPTLAGNTTVFGTMPDWNPAELIGVTPRPLALSLFQRLIGSHTWATARALIGYRDVRPEPLIVSLGGRPYVDVRASLNSFLPSTLADGIAESWTNHCLQLLTEKPLLHDKIEFEVAITCLSFDCDSQLYRLRAAGLNQAESTEFRQQLLRLTDGVLTGDSVSIDSQKGQLQLLASRRQRWLASPDSGCSAVARRIHMLLADCERFGTLPFAILARYAFIAMAILRSLREVGVFSEGECEELLGSIPTVASELTRDLGEHAAGRLSKSDLLERYRHLRPGSFDITSPNYASAWDTYFDPAGVKEGTTRYPDLQRGMEIFDARATEIENLLHGLAFRATVREVRDFVFWSIAGREWAKFEFMKSLNASLEAIAQVGEALGFSREEVSFLPVETILSCATDSLSSAVRTEFRRTIELHKKRWNLTSSLRLPHLVRSVDDVMAFRLEEWAANFISTKRVVAPVIAIEGSVPRVSLEGKIVLIRAADPGYDWVFSHRIAGLITQYGGAGSHMAIRAAEFGLPGAIGCGEVIFERLRHAGMIELDCGNKIVRAIA